MSMPSFLVVGAQKCGTTTLYEDLRSHPEIFLPDKESSGLIDLDPDDTASVQKYARTFESAGGMTTGEVSTLYSMWPKSGIAESARKILGTIPIFYIVREPVSRVISHHHHEYSSGSMGPDIDVEVRKCPELIDNSRYASQIRPWIESFGVANVHIIRFEDYVANRQAGAASLFRLLGRSPWELPTVDKAFNTATDKFFATGHWRGLSRNAGYRRLLRPLISERTRRWVMRLVLPKAPDRPSPPSAHTVDEIVRSLRPEMMALARITECEAWWDLEAVSKRFHE